MFTLTRADLHKEYLDLIIIISDMCTCEDGEFMTEVQLKRIDI